MRKNFHSVGIKIGYILSILFFSVIAYSQFTPARGTFVITPPYPNKLSDYGNPNLLKMNGTITATDPSFTSKPIRLKLSIFYNQQLLMQGNDMVVGERPMYLTMGQMLILTQLDLAPYFQQQNMRVSPVQYSQTLREGFYQFQLDILDYYTLQKIGLPLVASIYIMRYDPPQLYKPENKAVLMDKGQGLVQFQWNPRQIAPNTEYEFTIVELQQEKYVDPMIEFTARSKGSYYYKTTTRSTTLNYGMMGEMPLRWGKSYAWQVRAMTREGIDEVGTYEQDGYTDVRWFTYQKYCPVPTNIDVDVKSDQEATYTWDASPEHTSFILKITAADNPENTWLSVYPQEAKFEETQYRPDITYFYKLQGVCGEGKSEESGERSFTMLPRGQIKNFKCNEGDGKEPGGFESIANQKLLERDLVVGDTFIYGHWCKIAVKSVEKVGGYYRGRGVYRFPMAMFGFPLLNVIFDSITVNTDMEALSGGYDAVNRGMKGVADVDGAINTATNIVSNVQGIVEDVKQLVEDVSKFLDSYTGSEADKTKAKELHLSTDSLSNALMNNPNVPDSLKKQLEAINPEAQKAWEAFETGTPCEEVNNPNSTEKGGPYINYILLLAYQDTLNMRCYTSSIIEQKTIIEKMMETVGISFEETLLKDVTFIFQQDETIFGKCIGCWKSSCCRRAAEYMMGNKEVANCDDSVIAQNSSPMTIIEKVVLSSFSDNTKKYTSDDYNSATLQYSDSVQINNITKYIYDKIKNNKRPILIGIHYTGADYAPPNNVNRATRHYMVIVGFGTDKQGQYFRYYNPGSKNGNNKDNKVYIQKDRMSGVYSNGGTCTISEILKTN